ncbi:MAG: radical SAM protein [Desulfobacterales bacterium]|nr:radical SAM protein [Desulfobacterales bacterium]
MAKVLLINPSYQPSYGGTKASIVNPFFPTLGLATIAATAKQRGHEVEILDLCWRPYDYKFIQSRIKMTKPDIVGIHATTPLMNQLRDISLIAKDISRDIQVVGGGPHPTALPVETMRESMLDVICAGEADYTFADLCDSNDLSEIKNIYYRDGDEIRYTGAQLALENLDDLPMPAWELYPPEDYQRISKLIARNPPVTTVEFSRGCVYLCDFCASKMTMARGYRKKSPERCAEEVRYMHSVGFREFWLADDIFTSDQNWAYDVSEAIAKTELDVTWTCSNGIRVESANTDLFRMMKQAGCYRVSFGFESGNDEVLKSFGKGGRASVQEGRKAVREAQQAGIEVNGFFLLGLTGDTEETMDDTIEFARSLAPMDLLKFGKAVAFPGTDMFNNYAEKGLVKSYDWDNYFVYTNQDMFTHENLSYETIQKFMQKAYRRAITLNPKFAWQRFYRAITTGQLLTEIYYALKFFTNPIADNTESVYFAKDRWPVHDFEANPPQKLPYLETKTKQKVA